MPASGDRFYTAPVFLSTAFLLFGLALIEKVLNLVGWSIPIVSVYPRQLLEWAVILLLFEVALTLRQLADTRGLGPAGAGSPEDVVGDLH